MLRGENPSATPRRNFTGCSVKDTYLSAATFPIRGPIVERVDVSEPVSISSGIAKRYATAVFELAKDGNSIAALESDLDALSNVVAESAEFRDLITSPVYNREDQTKAMGALSEKMGLGTLTGNTLQLMGTKRRLFAIPQLIAALRALISEDKGEVTADVAAASKLTAAQEKALADVLAKSVGKDVKINMSVDESLIGGLVVKVGSRMIDTSIRAKLNSLQNSMKEVG